MGDRLAVDDDRFSGRPCLDVPAFAGTHHEFDDIFDPGGFAEIDDEL